MRRFETERSVYILDEDRYLRLPRSEAPTDDRNWQDSPNLIDNKWLDMVKWKLVNFGGEICLNIQYPNSMIGIITSPVVTGITDTEMEEVQNVQ